MTIPVIRLAKKKLYSVKQVEVVALNHPHLLDQTNRGRNKVGKNKKMEENQVVEPLI